MPVLKNIYFLSGTIHDNIIICTTSIAKTISLVILIVYKTVYGIIIYNPIDKTFSLCVDTFS